MHPLPAVGVTESELRRAEVPTGRSARLTGRLERERRAREEAERLLEVRSRELSEANVSLALLAAELERRVEERTSELAAERHRALRLSEEDSLTSLANRAHFPRARPGSERGDGAPPRLGRAHHRPRRLQVGERQLRPSRGRRLPPPGGAAHARRRAQGGSR